MFDVRQIVYTMAINGRVHMAQQASQILDEECVSTVEDLKRLAVRCGVSVSVDMPPSVILEEIIALEQYAQYH